MTLPDPPWPDPGYIHRSFPGYISRRGRFRHRWSAAEDDRLLRGYDILEPWESVARAIGLPLACIEARVRVLGIRRKPRRYAELLDRTKPRGAQRRCQAAAE